MARVRNIGLPANDSERKAISYLAKELPDSYVLLTNLELPTRNGFAYEYDIIIIGDLVVFVVELKGFGGVIKGNALEWELSSGKVIKSPIPLLNTKAKIVSSRLETSVPSLADVWVRPLLILTDDRVSVKVNDPFAINIKKLDESILMMTKCDKPFKDIKPTVSRKIEDAIANQFLPLKRDKELGEYRLIEQVSRNDLYTTFIAEHKLLRGEKRYLLKAYTLKIYADSEEQQKHYSRVLREAKTLSELPAHSNLVRADTPFTAGDDKVVLPLEWVDGHSLRWLLDEKASAASVPAKQILLALCSVLTYVHGYGIVHRDLRPDNVLVCADGTIRLVNFDCAHIGGQDMFTIATRVGRHLDERYVAPEVWKDPGNATIGSDIYSLGIIFHELLTGRTPYQKIKEIYENKEVKSSIIELRPDLDKEAEKLFLSMCAYDPRSRTSDLSDVQGWIEMLL
jgi:serine/threonine protein kinase